MAAMQKGGHKPSKLRRQDENIKPSKPQVAKKRTVSIAGLFDGAPNNSKNQRSSILHAGYGGLFETVKTTAAGEPRTREELFEDFAEKHSTTHAVFSGFKDAANCYHDGYNAFVQAELEGVCNELDARCKGLDKHGKPVSKAEIPSQAEIDALEKECARLERPITEQTFEVEVPQPDGSIQVRIIKLQDVLDRNDAVKHQKTAELDAFHEELKEVTAEIDELFDSLTKDKEGVVKQANELYQAEMVQHKSQLQHIKEQLRADFEKAQREHKAAKAETNRKLNDLAKALA